MADAAHWSECEAALRELAARSRFGVLSDFDGTLSHFAEFPDGAALVPESGAALDRLAASGVVVALISWRSAGDLRGRFPRQGIRYSGNHGLDYWDGAAVATVEVAVAWETALATLLAEIEPFDEGLHDFLIRATAQFSGVSAARTLCWESRTLFVREVGHVPPLLDILAQQLQQSH